MSDPEARREGLVELYREVSNCALCPLAETRTKTVFGAGNANAELMFVGEAPGAEEDRQGLPFVGRAGQLLSELLGEIGLSREDVFIANVLKSRPPGNRDPMPNEIEACQPYLWKQIALIQPTVIASLGNFATKLLSGNPTGHHEGPRNAAGPRAGRADRLLVPAPPSGGRPSDALDEGHASRGLREVAGAARTRRFHRPTSRRAPPDAADQLDFFG